MKFRYQMIGGFILTLFFFGGMGQFALADTALTQLDSVDAIVSQIQNVQNQISLIQKQIRDLDNQTASQEMLTASVSSPVLDQSIQAQIQNIIQQIRQLGFLLNISVTQ